MADAKVRYKGASDVRILPADQLQALGVTGIDKDLVFSPANMWSRTVPMSDELEAVLRGEGTFTIEPVKDDGTTGDNETNVDAESKEVIDDTADTVVMPDGQVDKANDNVPLSSESGATAGPDTDVATGRG
jgi:hypothetical protein